MTEQEIRAIVLDVVKRGTGLAASAAIESEGHGARRDMPCELSETVSYEVPVEASARHVHLDRTALTALFGADAELLEERPLSQPGEFLSQYRVKLVSEKGQIDGVAVLGPLRKTTQVEISLTDSIRLGLKAPINLSGHLDGAADITLLGPKGSITARQSTIVARAHIHFRPDDARKAGVENGDHVRVRVSGCRCVTLDDVVIRVGENYLPALHIDFDEANACGLNRGSKAFIVGRSSGKRQNDRSQNEAAVREGDGAQKNAEGGKMNHFDSPGNPLALTSMRAARPSGTKRQVITEKQARVLVDRGQPWELPSGAILTPSAKDVFRAAGLDM